MSGGTPYTDKVVNLTPRPVVSIGRVIGGEFFPAPQPEADTTKKTETEDADA